MQSRRHRMKRGLAEINVTSHDRTQETCVDNQSLPSYSLCISEDDYDSYATADEGTDDNNLIVVEHESKKITPGQYTAFKDCGYEDRLPTCAPGRDARWRVVTADEPT